MADENLYDLDPLMIEGNLEDWVMSKCEDWRDHYESTTSRSLMSTTDSGVASGIQQTRCVIQKDHVLSHPPYSKPLNLTLQN